MTPGRYNQVTGLFLAARDLPPSRREEFLAERCGLDDSLLVEVKRWLRGDQTAASLLDKPALGAGLAAAVVEGGAAGAMHRWAGGDLDPKVIPMISGFKITIVIANGGMGTVYEAEQVQPHRRVALKVIREGFSSPSLMRRFEAEAEILGRLQHPGIAQIYEAGTFDSGRGKQPFFAMELIKGRPLTRFAQEQKLSVRQRLDLFTRVCQAVQHAHGRGIIHRDLKPANILVEESGQPKILDFGVARATDSDIKTATLQTDIGQLIGTLSYMSPEQAGGDPDDLDTRSDVYALGVIAYELLSDRMPYDLNQKMIHEAVRIIREDQPSKLSTTSRTLRGDMEVIVGKALQKEKSQRYQTAAALQADIERYLRNEPIAARPPSTWYQLSKFSRRNKALVGGVVASFVILLGGLGATLWQAGEANKQAKRADERTAAAIKAEGEAQAQKVAAVASAKAETERAEQLKQVSDFQAQMLDHVDPTQAGILLTQDVTSKFEEALTKASVPEADRAAQLEAFKVHWRRVNATDVARELIDGTILRPAIDAINKQFKDQPVVDAQLRQVLADRYGEMGLYEAALPLQQQALATRRRVLGEEHPDTLSSIGNMGVLLEAQDKLVEAAPYYREALEKSRRVLGAEHQDTLKCIANMGYLFEAQDKPAEAESYFRDVLEKSRRVLGEEHPDTLVYISNMGALLKARRRFVEAEPYMREALEKKRRVLGPEHPSTLTSINNMGSLLQDLNRLPEAEPYLREALEGLRRVLGEEHPTTLVSIENMCDLLKARGKLAEAELYSREALKTRRRVQGEEHPDTLQSISSMGVLLQAQGRLAEAEPYLREALEGLRRVLGEEHPTTLGAVHNMGALFQAQGKSAEAEVLLLPAAAVAQSKLPAHHRVRLALTRDVMKLYEAWEMSNPGKGYADKAAEWKGKLEAMQSAAGESKSDEKK